MKIFDITVSRIGFATIQAETKEEALEIAESMATEDFEWAGIEITDYQEV